MVADIALRTVNEEIMSEILNVMKDDLKKAMKREIECRKDGTNNGLLFEVVLATKYVIKSVLSMFPEIDLKPENATDEDTLQLLKKFIFKEKTSELYTQGIFTAETVSALNPNELKTFTKQKITELGNTLTSLNIGIALTYVPKEATESQIREWIIENIDFSNYKNKMQSMRVIIDHFKGADGNLVKNIIMSM